MESRPHRSARLRHRIGIVLHWPLGLMLITWRYLWRVTPVYRRDEEGGPEDLPPPLPDGVGRDGVQWYTDGYGALLHRCYAVRALDPRVGPEEVVAQLAADPNSAAPGEAAVFVKSKEAGDTSVDGMAVGDEYVVRMPGPWDGPVRVVHRTATSFRFVTLRGHLEAGEIEFRARCERGDSGGTELVFEIESWARPGDRVSHLLYNKLLLAKEIQLNLWTETCLGVVRNSGGRLHGGVRVRTRRVDVPPAVTDASRGVSAAGRG